MSADKRLTDLEINISFQERIIEELNNKIDYLIEYQTGDWEIKDKKMIFYDENLEVLEDYDLFNANGIPTNTSVYKRVKRAKK